MWFDDEVLKGRQTLFKNFKLTMIRAEMKTFSTLTIIIILPAFPTFQLIFHPLDGRQTNAIRLSEQDQKRKRLLPQKGTRYNR